MWRRGRSCPPRSTSLWWSWWLLLLAGVERVAPRGGPDTIFLDYGRRRMLSVSSGTCHFNDDGDTVSWMVERAPYGMVREIGSNELDYMVDACNWMQRPAASRPSLFIYPGTKWCGSGSMASSFGELGSLRSEDQCCRSHDFCPASLRAGQCRNGLCNPSAFTRSHCECDVQFRRCLQEVGTATSHALGALYFNIARVPCFSEQPRPPSRRNARVFGGGPPCDGPFCGGGYGEPPPRYQYHRVGPYSAPFFGGLSYPTFTSLVPTTVSNVLLTVFKFIGAV